MRLELGFNGDEMDFIHLVNSLSLQADGMELDSLDAGDAMGWVIQETMRNGGEFHYQDSHFILLACFNMDLFQWKGLESDGKE